MAIKTSNTNIEFIYEAENGSEDHVHVKFHQTEQFGDTISLSSDHEEWFPFPASLFSETTDFLRSQHQLGVKLKNVAPAPRKVLFAPSPHSQSSLKLPEIEETEETETETEPPKPLQMAEIDPVQSLAALGQGNITTDGKKNVEEETEEQGEEEPAPQNFGRPVVRSSPNEINQLSDEELLARQKLTTGDGIKRV